MASDIFFNTTYKDTLIAELGDVRYGSLSSKVQQRNNLSTLSPIVNNIKVNAAFFDNTNERTIIAKFENELLTKYTNKNGETVKVTSQTTRTNTTPQITDINIDIGGTDKTGRVVKGSMTIELAGHNNLEILLSNVAVIGNSFKIGVKNKWNTGVLAYPEANELSFQCRVFNFSYTAGGEYETSWKVTIDFMSSSTGYSNLNVFSPINIKSDNIPSWWPKSLKVRDEADDVTGDIMSVTNLNELFSAIWDFEKSPAGLMHINSEILIRESRYKMFFQKIKTQDLDAPWYNGTDPYGIDEYYINLDGIINIVNSYITYQAKESEDLQLEDFKITYPVDAAGNESYTGGWCEYMTTANPNRILLLGTKYPFNGTFTGKGASKAIKEKLLYQATKQDHTNKSNYFNTDTTRGDIRNIFISRTVLIEIAEKVLTNKSSDETVKAKSINLFFKKIFDEIKLQTGEIIDLRLSPNVQEAASGNNDTILTVADFNASPKLEDLPEPIGFYIYPGTQGHIINYEEQNGFAITGKVPQSLASKAFVKNANIIASPENSNTPNAQIVPTLTQAEIDILELKLKNLALRYGSDTSKVNSDSTLMQDILKELYRANIINTENKTVPDTDDIIASKRVTTTLELSIQSNGINGFEWGHALVIKPLPSTVPDNTAFMITKINHKVATPKGSTEKQWITTLTCQATIKKFKPPQVYYGE